MRSLGVQSSLIEAISSLRLVPVADVVLRPCVVEPRVGVLVRGAEAERVGRLAGVLAAERGDAVAAGALGRARLDVLVAERLEALGLVVRHEADEIVIAHAAAGVAVEVIAFVGVVADLDRAVGVLREPLGHDVDDAADRLGAVIQRLPALEHLDALDHVRRQRVERRGRGVEPVVDAHAVDEEQHLAGPRSGERGLDVVERADLGIDEQPGHQRQRAGGVDVPGLVDRLALDDLDARAVFGQLLRHRFLELLAEHDDCLVALVGSGIDFLRQRRSGRQHRRPGHASE